MGPARASQKKHGLAITAGSLFEKFSLMISLFQNASFVLLHNREPHRHIHALFV
jgi:hypothetical protein